MWPWLEFRRVLFRSMPRDLFDAVCGIADDEPILPQLLDGQMKRLTRGQDAVLAPLRVGFVLGREVRQGFAQGRVHVARDVELLAQTEPRRRKGLALRLQGGAVKR